jgi:hypothetical protein
LLNREYGSDEHTFSSEERNSIQFVNNLNKVLHPKHLQINDMTYNIRHDQDTLHPGHGAAIMLLSCEDGPNAHPFWCAEVLGTFLIRITYSGIERTMEFLWIRWFGVVPGYHWGLKNARLSKIGFTPSDSGTTFGFVDPSLALHACHLIPAFSEGHTDSLLHYRPSVARETNTFNNWAAYYVNM